MNCKKDGFNEDELIRRATAAWLRRCRRKGCLEDQPSAGLSECRDGVVTLKNVSGILVGPPLGAVKERDEKGAIMAKKAARHEEVAEVKTLEKTAPTARTCRLVERLMMSLEDLAEGLGEGYCPHLVADHIRDWFEEWMADYERRWAD